MTTILSGHTTPETAYVVNDYPYGFRLRCKIRYWLEYKKHLEKMHQAKLLYDRKKDEGIDYRVAAHIAVQEVFIQPELQKANLVTD